MLDLLRASSPPSFNWLTINMHPLSISMRAVFALSVVLNLAAIIYICKSQMGRSSWNDSPYLYVINMVVADFLLGVGGLGKYPIYTGVTFHLCICRVESKVW